MKLRLILIYIFNIIDTVATLYVTHNGGIELNPICNWLLQWPLFFVFVKIGVATVTVLVAWKLRENTLARIVSWVLFVEYALIAIYYATMFIYCQCIVF